MPDSQKSNVEKLPCSFTLFDSYQKKEVQLGLLDTVEKGVIKIYSCGPTVYNYQTIGNMRAVWIGDTISKVANIAGYKSQWVSNITDVGHLVDDGDDGKNVTNSQDKLEKGAKREGKNVRDIVDFYTLDFQGQCRALRLDLPLGKMNPKATEYIPEQMVLALKLLQENKAYILDDGIYFNSKYKEKNSPLLAKGWQTKSDGVVLQDYNPIKVIIFDVDGVLTYGFEDGEYKWPKQIAEKYNLDLAKINDFFRDNQEPWIGKGDLKKQIEPYLKDCGWQLSVEEFLKEWFNFDFHPVQETINLAKNLKEMGYRLAVATQQESYRNQFLKDNLLPEGLFEEVFSTCEVGFTKNNLNFWNHITEKLELAPSQIVMIDDNVEVLEISKKIGFKTILYEHGISDIDLEIKVLFESKEKPNYTGRDIVNTTKDPEDFALWKFVEENSLQKWKFSDFPVAVDLVESIYNLDQNQPLNKENLLTQWGCPGWHSECVAMISEILGERRFSTQNFPDHLNAEKHEIDIHTGGEDHIDIHHKNERLQSEALGVELSKLWVHNKFVLVDSKKMSKSLGNVYTVQGKFTDTGFYSFENPPVHQFSDELKQQIIKKYKELKISFNFESEELFWESFNLDPLAYKLMMFEHHFTQQMNFTWEKLWDSQSRLWNLRRATAKISSFALANNVAATIQSKQIEVLLKPLLSNLDVPKFLEKFQGFLDDIVGEIVSKGTLDSRNLGVLEYWENNFLALDLLPEIPAKIIYLADLRNQAKINKDYALSDNYRDQISSNVFQIDDHSWGYGVWKR